jgi:pterin-4a-carbinolamine dehydratase
VVKVQQVSIRGTPDFLLCVSGVFVAIELKTDDGKLDKLQEWNLKKIADTGGIAIVLTPSNLDKTMEFLSDIAQQAQDYFKQNPIIQ